MSNTVVTKFANISGKSTNADKSVVIIVNKDGSVSLEKETLQSLLDKQHESTNVSIVRMNEDGKPDDASDHSSDETIPHINLTVDAFFNSVTNEDDKGSQNEYISDLFGSEISLIGFQNDHCYTPLTSPSQSRRSSECDTVHYKNETASYLPNTQKHNIPSSKKITVLENKIIAKGKNVQHYNAGNPKEVLRGSDLSKHSVSSNASPNVQLVKRIEIDRASQLKTVNINENVLSKCQDNFSDNDIYNEFEQDPEFDYFNEGINRDNRLQSPLKKSLLKKDIKKILSRKIEQKNNGLLNVAHSSEHDQNISHRNRKSSKHYNDEKMKNSVLKNDQFKGNDVQLNTKLINDSDNFKDYSKSDLKLDLQKNQQKLLLKKDKKPPAHMTALLNDMTSLFSTPDVIRRISTDSKPPKTPDRLINNSLSKKSDEQMSFSLNLDKNVDSIHNTKLLSPKSDTKTYANSNANINKTQTKTMSDITSRRHKNQKEGLDIMSPFDDDSFAQLLQETTNAEMLSPVNMPMVLGSVNDANITMNTNTALMSPNSLSAAGLHAPLSPSLDLLSGLQHEEEALPEDLLRHVAELVENADLQQVIDKEVLGKVNLENLVKTVHAPPMVPKIEEPVPIRQIMVEPEKPVNVSNLPRKEPIQIMRSNGRIITLPPIEAPATRSSKRKSLMNASVEINPGVSSPDVSKLTPQTKPPAKPINTYSRVHKTSESKSATQTQPDKKDDDAESDESWNSEDDPDRLWCICKQPHNNRFMICCDSCEDWFHGKCVNVTKAMGQDMEEKGIEWRCPNCIKKKGLADSSMKSLPLRKSIESKVDEKSPHLPTENRGNVSMSTSCIVCKKPARVNSIYCGESCILKHAQESVNLTTTPAKGSRENVSVKPRPDTRVIVCERKTGKILAGSSAPTLSNLKVWLQENPTFEVVQPGSKPIAPANKPRPKPNSPKVQSLLTLGQDKQVLFTSPLLKSSGITNKTSPKTAVPSSPTNLKSPVAQNKPQTVKAPLKSPPAPKTPTTQPKQNPLKSPTASTSQKRDDTSTPHRYSNSSEPIRENVRKTLREEISKRMTESKDVTFTAEEILKFSIDTEYELHDLFKDVGTKYKAKYRSLMFNLKDRKNLTLWHKICDHSITPKQLVRLSPEELASQELAQWRDKEVKHQLELIKKSELDLLSCNKTYVLKTHKGEEVMESRTTGTAELDPNVPVEDLVSALNKSVDVGGSIGNGSEQTSPVATPRDDRHSSHHKHSKHRSKTSKNSKSSNKNSHTSTKHESSSSKHKSSKDSKSDSRSHHRKSSRDRDRKSSSSRRRSDSSRHSSRSKPNTRHEDDRKYSRRSSSSSKDDQRNSKDKDNKKEEKEEFKIDLIGLENIRSPVLHDVKVEDDIVNTLLSPNSDSLKSPETPELNLSQKLASTESDQEPTSTVDSMVWNGVINMIDVAKFSVSAYEVSGQCDDVISELEGELDVVGRISPHIVWDYINKMKKQGYNDISVMKFVSSSEEEKTQYTTLYTYLSTRNRLGVICVNNGGIKDFYILPLSSNASLPPVLLPLQGPGFESIRPNLLLGIIVKQRRKRVSHISSLSAVPSKIAKIGHSSDRSYTPPTDGSYTPPSSPKRKLPLSSTASGVISGMPLPSFLPNLSSTVRDKIAATLASVDDDEPYSPGGSDSGSLERSRSPSSKQSVSDDLQRKMEELTRKIEEEKKQIENMAVTISRDSLDEPYSPSRPMSPSSAENPISGPMSIPISSISLPTNLQEILASIHEKTKAQNSDLTDSQSSTEAYVPQSIMLPGSHPPNAMNSQYYPESFSGDVDMRMIPAPVFSSVIPNFNPNQMDTPPQKGASKLSTLSEAELLSMVPDDEILLPTNKMNRVYPPLPSGPPLPLTDTSVPPPHFKRQKRDYGQQPPPPGFEGS